MGHYLVSSWCAMHSSGTKFYEMVHIRHSETGACALYKRWGKINVINTEEGGEDKLEALSLNAFNTHRHSKLKGKADGSYSSDRVRMGIFNPHRNDAALDEDLLKSELAKSYGGRVTHRIMSLLNPTGAEMPERKRAIIKESPKPATPIISAAEELASRLKHNIDYGTW